MLGPLVGCGFERLSDGVAIMNKPLGGKVGVKGFEELFALGSRDDSGTGSWINFMNTGMTYPFDRYYSMKSHNSGTIDVSLTFITLPYY